MGSKTLQSCLRRAFKRWHRENREQHTSTAYRVHGVYIRFGTTGSLSVHSAALSRRLLCVENVAHHKRRTYISCFVYFDYYLQFCWCVCYWLSAATATTATNIVRMVYTCVQVRQYECAFVCCHSGVLEHIYAIYFSSCVSIRSAAVRWLAQTAAFSIIRVVYLRSRSQSFSIMSVLSTFSINLHTLYFIIIIYTSRGRHFSRCHSV